VSVALNLLLAAVTSAVSTGSPPPTAVSSSLLSTGVSRQATDTHSFTRYQIIVDRAPFGAMTGLPDDAPQPNFATRFTFIGTAKTNETGALMAIIQDKENNNRVYFKSAGETIGGVTIDRVDSLPTPKLTLKQGLETATLTLETKPGPGRPGVPMPTVSGGQPQQPSRPGQGPAAAPQGPRRIPFLRGG
jgi:hypothetical protein